MTALPEIPHGAIENGRAFLQRLTDHYDFTCEAGPLSNCSDYHEAVRCFEHIAQWIADLAAPHLAAVQVKKLEWGESRGRWFQIGMAPRYEVIGGATGDFVLQYNCQDLSRHPTLEDAKAAAQADHETRFWAMAEPSDTFKGTVDGDNELQAAAREAGWALIELVDEIDWLKRGQVSEIISRLGIALNKQADVPADPEYVDCECTKVQQDETCPVGYPSLLCEICDGKGVVQPSAGRAAVLEEAAKLADRGNAAWLEKRDVTANKKEARDYETMAIACSHVAAAIRALSSHPQADKPIDDGAQGEGWLPIESAPRDGTAVLVHFLPNEVPSLNPLICAAYWQKSDGLMKPGYWRVFHSVGPSFTATHWRPLPTPPAGEVA